MDEKEQFLIYIASAPQDEALRKTFETHLHPLTKRYQIELWHPSLIFPGMVEQEEQEKHLARAGLIVALLSPDFFQECEAELAFLTSNTRSTMMLPIMLRPIDLEDTLFEGLKCLPQGGGCIVDSRHRDQDFREIADAIRHIVRSLITPQKKRNREKEQKLTAMLADHSAFLQDRLNSFVGRERELAEIQERIAVAQEDGGYITITGQAGQGKSSIIAKLVEIYGEDKVASHFIPFNPGPDHQVGLLRNLMARLILKHDLSDLYVATESRPALRDYFINMLRELAAKDVQEIIFIDGLDQIEEDLNGVRDLSFLPASPLKGIVFVLGTRPDDSLRPLELLKPHVEYRLPNLSRVDFDLILAHRGVSLETYLVTQFYQAMQENALYLDLLAKELREQEALSPQVMIERIASDPNNLFTLSLQRLKRNALEWREVLKPILGFLLAAREPLLYGHLRQLLPNIDDERLRDGLARLGGLLTVTGQRAYALFHLKLQDYLREDEQNPSKTYVFAKDEEEHYHALLAQWCEQGGISHIWEDAREVREQSRRVYARQHYVTHLYRAQLDEQLFMVLDEGSYGRAKEQHDRTTRSYIHDLDLGRQAAAHQQRPFNEAMALLPALWHYTLLRCTLRSQADNYPWTLFQGLLLVQRESEVLGLAELLTDARMQVNVLLRLALHLASDSRKQVQSTQAFLRAESIARSIEEADGRAEALHEICTALVYAQQWERAEEMARSIEEDSDRAWALSSIVAALAKAQQWERAEEMASFIDEGSNRAWALGSIVAALAEAQQWERAEEMARSIEDTYQKACALRSIASALVKAQQRSILLGVVKRSWLFAETRNYAIDVFPLASDFIVRDPGLERKLLDAFVRVENFLKNH